MGEWIASILYWIEDHKTLVQGVVGILGPAIAAVVVVRGWRVNAAQTLAREKRNTLIQLSGALHSQTFLYARRTSLEQKLTSGPGERRVELEVERIRSIEAIAANNVLIAQLSTGLDFEGVDINRVCLFLTLEPELNSAILALVLILILHERKGLDGQKGLEQGELEQARSSLNAYQREREQKMLAMRSSAPTNT